MGGIGSLYLKELLDSIGEQDFGDYEIIVSDHSKDDEVKNVCIKNSKVKYFRNEKNRGNGAANINNAVSMSSGKYVKLIFQDDLFYSSETLSTLKEIYEKEDVNWIVSGSCHTVDAIEYNNFISPVWSPLTLYGDNQIGSPSVCSFKRSCFLEFDLFYTLLYDVDFYYRMVIDYGLPYFCDKPLVAIRRHQHQTTNNVISDVTLSNGKWNWGIPKNEYEYILGKYGKEQINI